MTLHWHHWDRFEDPAAALSTLEALGVRMGEPLDRPMDYYWSAEANGVLVDIGSLKLSVPSGEITIRPRNDCAGIYLRVLIGSAAQAFGRSRPGGGWDFHRRKAGNFWWTNQVTRAHKGDAVAEYVQAAREVRPEAGPSSPSVRAVPVRVSDDWRLVFR